MKCPGRKDTKNLPELAKDFSLTSEVLDFTTNETSIMKVITKLGPEVFKKIMINSAEHELFPAQKC